MFSQTTEYALRAAVWLAESEGSAQTTSQIARATQVPAGYLAKVLQALARGGIVLGARGLHGGFELTRPAADITILDIVNIVEPIKRIKTCPLRLNSHARKLCPLHKRLDDAVAAIEQSFGSTTLADLLSNPAHRPLCGAAPVPLQEAAVR